MSDNSVTEQVMHVMSLFSLGSGNDSSYTVTFFSYAILANPEVEPHAPNTYQLKLVPGSVSGALTLCKKKPDLMNINSIFGGEIMARTFDIESLVPIWIHEY